MHLQVPQPSSKVKVVLVASVLTLHNPMDCSLQGSSVHGIFQASILEWVTISSPGDLPNPGIEPGSPALQADTLLSEPEIIFFLDLLRCY